MLRTSPNPPLRGNQGTDKVKAPEVQQSHKGKKRKVKKKFKKSRKFAKRSKNSTALFPMYISLRKYFQDFCPTNQIKITEQRKKHKSVPRRFPMLQRYLFNKYHVWIKWDHQPSHKMVLQIFNEAMQCVICRVVVGAHWLQEGAAPRLRVGDSCSGGEGRHHWNPWKSGTCQIKNDRVISKTQSSGQWNEVFAFYLMKEWSDIKLCSIWFHKLLLLSWIIFESRGWNIIFFWNIRLLLVFPLVQSTKPINIFSN